MEFKAHKYQEYSIGAIVERSALFLMLDMGLGKTPTTLTGMLKLLNAGKVLKPLVIAPKKVLEGTWPEELEKWDHLHGMTCSYIHGTARERIAAIGAVADFYMVSVDNIKWLIDHMGKLFDFDMLVVDESSKFKNRSSKRFKAIEKHLSKFKRVLLLSGTPVSNGGLLDLWSQLYMLDRGSRLHTTLTGYRHRYFNAVERDGRIKYEIRPGSDTAIKEKIADLCISMSAEDYLQLPPRTDITQTVPLHNFEEYRRFMRDRVLDIGGGEMISPDNIGALYNKALQFCNGAVYHEDRKSWTEVGTDKLDALEEYLEIMEGDPVLIPYCFRSDVERIQKRMPWVRLYATDQDKREWNDGKIRAMMLHPTSGGHGLNLQYGSANIAWFGVPWSYENYIQTVKRIDRQGQTRNVFNRHFLSKGTVEDKVADGLSRHGFTSRDLMDHFKKLV